MNSSQEAWELLGEGNEEAVAAMIGRAAQMDEKYLGQVSRGAPLRRAESLGRGWGGMSGGVLRIRAAQMKEECLGQAISRMSLAPGLALLLVVPQLEGGCSLAGEAATSPGPQLSSGLTPATLGVMSSPGVRAAHAVPGAGGD